MEHKQGSHGDEQKIFADLHIHLGRTKTDKPVKITASKQMTIEAVLYEASARKGLGMIGVIDCHVPEVLAELKQLLKAGQAVSLPGGGVRFGQTTLILGTEMEIWDPSGKGPIHVLCYLPGVEEMSRFSRWMSKHQKNITLSSQRSYVSMHQLQREVRAMEGLFIPAHIFTPYKSVYGKGVETFMAEVIDLKLVDAVELGLSSDTTMADQLPELAPFTFLTNSDAHSLAKIGREYQQLRLKAADFHHLRLALHRREGQQVVANFGLDPKLGKYHLEVSRRIQRLSAAQHQALAVGTAQHWGRPFRRPPYIYQVPLEFIPGIGPSRLKRMIDQFGSEMYVLHHASWEELRQWVPDETAEMIIRARERTLTVLSGGGGRYGRVSYPGESEHRV